MSTTMIVAIGISVVVGAVIIIFATMYFGRGRKNESDK